MFGHFKPHNRYNPNYDLEYFSVDRHNSKYSIQILKPGYFRSIMEGNCNKYHEFKRNGSVYYAVPHNSEYLVKMHNEGDLRVDATLKIDGIDMGTWRIEPYSSITIERPSNNNRKFTFVREGSWQGNMGGVAEGNFDNGLVEVTFIPEYRHSGHRLPLSELDRGFFSDSLPITNNITQRANCKSYSTGGTVLGDDSFQRFTDASYLTKDYSKKVTKRVRLVVEENRKPYAPLGSHGHEADDLYDDPIPPRINRFSQSRDHYSSDSNRHCNECF